MNDIQPTRYSLLIRLSNAADSQAWSEFVRIYTPVVYRYARRRGLQDADAADVTQEVLRTVARSIATVDCSRERGYFRGWLMSVVRSRMSDFAAARQRQALGSADSAILQRLQEHPAAEEAIWEDEYRRGVFAWAVEQVRGNFRDATWQAFWQTGVEGKDTKVVASKLGMSEGAVYIARCRVLAQLKETIRQIEQ